MVLLFLTSCSSIPPQDAEPAPESSPLPSSAVKPVYSQELEDSEDIRQAAAAAAERWGQDLIEREGRSDEQIALEYHVLDAQVYEISEKQDAFCFDCVLAIRPQVFDSEYWRQGRYQVGAEEWDGFLLLGAQIKTEKLDGEWVIHEIKAADWP